MPKRTLRRFLSDPAVRGAFFLYGGAAFHFLYALFRFFTGWTMGEPRLDTAALFYLSLGTCRLFLIEAHRQGEGRMCVLRALRRVGRLFFFTALLVLFRLASVLQGGGAYPTGTVAVSGAYALASSVLAILELWLYRRLTCPILSASRAVGLSSALLSAYTFLSDLLLALSAVGERARLFLLLVLGALIVFLHLFLALGFLRYGERMGKRR